MRSVIATNVVRVAAVLVIVFFFTPWGTVSCGDEELGTFSGWDLATGIETESNEFAAQDERSEPEILFVLVAAVVTLVLSALLAVRRVDAAVANVVIIVMAVISMVIMYTNYRDLKDEAERGGAVLDLRYGAYISTGALIAIVVAATVDFATATAARRSRVTPPESAEPP
jgi:hypothetical protein